MREGVRVVFEDEHLAVVTKPAGMVVHRGAGSHPGTLVLTEVLGGRLSLAPEAGEDRPGIVHRLDKDTSGLLVVAKTGEAYHLLVAAIGERTVERRYLALAAGRFRLPTGRIEAPVERHPGDRTRRRVSPSGKFAATEFKVLESFDNASLLDVKLETGRTHQIRLHLAHIGHPVVGDRLYGKPTLGLAETWGLTRPFLHAARLSFRHPVTDQPIEAEEPLPADLQACLSAARGARTGAGT